MNGILKKTKPDITKTENNKKVKFRKLTLEEEGVIVNKGTEAPFSGEYERESREGTYYCKRCNLPLYNSKDKFDARCGWPSFDQEIPGAVKRIPDSDGERIEIECSRCGAHLGHVFEGEGFTKKNVRHCVNSISMTFVPKASTPDSKKGSMQTKTIALGGGCFWCTEAVFSMFPGISKVEPGYAGGKSKNPTYREVCGGETGHAEVLKIEYNPETMPLEKLLEIFFAMHDPTTPNRQGADSGSQYRSIILYSDDDQRKAAEDCIKRISEDYKKPIVTEIKRLDAFYPSEEYHKNYYKKNPLQPYCLLVISPKVNKIKKEFGLG